MAITGRELLIKILQVKDLNKNIQLEVKTTPEYTYSTGEALSVEEYENNICISTAE